MATIQIDYENSAERWWDAVHSATDTPDCLGPLLESSDEGDVVTVTADEAAAVLAWAAALPGWSDADAPVYAPHPLIVHAEAAHGL